MYDITLIGFYHNRQYLNIEDRKQIKVILLSLLLL